MIRVYDALKNGYLLNKTVDLSSKTMTLDAAKDLLRHTGTVSGQTISFSNDVWAMILDNEEAVDLLEAAYAKGWGSNEPDLIVIADSGYNGQVRLNNTTVTQLTEVGSTGVWFKENAGAITSLRYYLAHDGNASFYNSTSVYIKKVRFGKNIDTSGLISMNIAFGATNSNSDAMETIDVTHLNTSNVTNMYGTFGGYNDSGTLKLIGYQDFDVSKVTNFGVCFASDKIKDPIDLHKWHTLSNADLTNMFRPLNLQANVGTNYPVYYTPGYWQASTQVSTMTHALTVYPYHDITVAASSGFAGTCLINGNSVNMTQDSTLGIWYYDIPSNTTLSSLSNCFNSNSNLISASFADSIKAKLGTSLDMYRIFRDCANLLSVDVSNIAHKASVLSQFASSSTILSNIYGLDKCKSKTLQSSYIVQNNTSIRYLKFGVDLISEDMNRFANNASNLIRLSDLPAIPNGTITTSAFNGCSSLTTIDASGNIAETIDFSPCPLTLASAKVILNALQTVSGKTLTFSTTTKGYINADSEALALVASARSKGWTIAL